ncbi:MAG: UvrB/UvrC motif-containing protein [bacterium]|nr:UvrB/UvrC motif-containing protein [bacterium]
MNRQALQKKKLPGAPGVYFFLGRNKKVLYIGRATSLRNRVRSYFDSALRDKRSPWIEKMMREARGIDFKKTDSVLEAILLEADLIKRFKPPYNTELKDDKSFNCIVITDEEFPRVLLVRSGTLRASSTSDVGDFKHRMFSARSVFGPFPNSSHLKTALKIIRKIFPFRDSCNPYSSILQNNGITRPCFNRQIGLCPGVCTGEITVKEYCAHIKRLALFLAGKKARIQKAIEREMRAAAKRQEFEKAGELKRQLFALKHIQDVALIATSNNQLPTTNLRIEAYDLSHFGGKNIVGAMAVVENGEAEPSEYRMFKLRTVKTQNEVAGLREIIRRRLNHAEWPFPQLIVVDGNEVQKKAAEKVIAEAGHRIPVVAVVKDERHRPREKLSPEILLANAEAHRFALKFQKKQRK